MAEYFTKHRMRFLFILVVISSGITCSAAVEPWRSSFGLMAGLNTSQLAVYGPSGSVSSTMLWSAGFGVYFKTNTKNMFRLEGQTGIEGVGANESIYYLYSDDHYLRIYDRYTAIPLILFLNRSLGWKESWSVGIGFKSSFVVKASVRHDGRQPFGVTAFLVNPEVQKWFGAPVLQLSHHFPYADLSLCGWYAITPLIDENNVKVTPYGLSFAVKVPLFNLNF